MMRSFSVFIAAFILIPLSVLAEGILLGKVQQVEGDLIEVMTHSNRQYVSPEELVVLQSKIPGIDEVVESARAYVTSSKIDTVILTLIDGDPAIGDEVVLLKDQFLAGELTKDVGKWSRLSYEDIRNQGFNKKEDHNVGAVCALARMHVAGEAVAKDLYQAYVLFGYATEQFQQPPPDCAAEYGLRLLSGDPQNNRWITRPEDGFRWVRYAAENGSYLGMSLYAMSLKTIGKNREAAKWIKAAIKNEPAEHKGKAQNLWDAIQGR